MCNIIITQLCVWPAIVSPSPRASLQEPFSGEKERRQLLIYCQKTKQKTTSLIVTSFVPRPLAQRAILSRRGEPVRICHEHELWSSYLSRVWVTVGHQNVDSNLYSIPKSRACDNLTVAPSPLPPPPPSQFFSSLRRDWERGYTPIIYFSTIYFY